MPQFLSLHRDPSVSKDRLEAKWTNLAKEREAIWVKTWYNLPSGRRFCWWDAPTREAVEQIFAKHGVSWEEIIRVELTTPSEWRWREG